MDEKTVRRRILFVTLLIGLLFFNGETNVSAAVPKTGPEAHCTICHQVGGPHNQKNLKPEYQGPEGCINCHSSSESSTTYVLEGEMGESVTVPVVNYTGSSLAADAPILAGGNFFWVQTEDSKGHNIFPTNPESDLINGAPFDPGPAAGCSWDTSCHRNFDLVNDMAMPGLLGRQGCTKCHMLEDFSGPNWDDTDASWLSHHRDDSNLIVGSEVTDGDVGVGDGYFRFLRGHQSGDGHGVCGIEDPDWQATSNSSDHNEYLGFSGEKNVPGNLSNLGHTATGFCCGCHGNKHISSADPEGGNWILHPSGALPLDGQYTEYNPQNPVSRPDLTGWTGPSNTVDSGTGGEDMVMCLSCHRAHGSPYPKMLRWETVGGCDDCHISTTQCAE
jgi:predicted CXXCH cytochrome family protein